MLHLLKMSYLLSKNREERRAGHFAPWLIEGDIGIFDFGYFLDRFFGFCAQKLFDFGIHCGLRISVSLVFVFREKY